MGSHIYSRYTLYLASKKIPGRYVGIAVYSPTLNIQLLYKIPSASVYTGEALAILQTLDYILANIIPTSVIFTDSHSIVFSISSPNFGQSENYIIYLIRQRLFDINQLNLKVSIVWIPAHLGILGNETANMLAKRAIIHGVPITSLLSYSDFYELLRDKFQKNSERILKPQATYKGTVYFNFFPNFSLKTWFKNMKISRESITSISRLRSGHYALNYSLFRCNLSKVPGCQCGHPLQDANHIFWNCPLLSTKNHLS